VDVAFPESVVSLFHGDLGQPPGGFPASLQKKILQGATPLTVRPGSILPPADLSAARAEAEKRAERHISEVELASYLMYPDVFVNYALARRKFGDLTDLPTPAFFYGMESGEEVTVDLDRGPTLIVRYLGTSEHHDDGMRSVYFELNGQPRTVKIEDRGQAVAKPPRVLAEVGNPRHVGAPMPGLIAQVNVRGGDDVKKGDPLMTIEAMKMQTSIRAERDGRIEAVVVEPGWQVDAKDLLLVFA